MDFMNIVKEICAANATDCRSLNKSDLARKLMDMVHIPEDAQITENPLDFENQVEILFVMPNDNNYYGLCAGHWLDGSERMYLTIIGEVHRRKNRLNFYFFDRDEEINLDYFQRY